MSEKRIGIFREIVIVLVLGLVLVSSLSIKTVNAQAGQIGLLPTDDTYVDSNSPSLNYGNSSHLLMENYQSFIQTYQEIIWLKFNLSSIPEGAVIDNATLHLYFSAYVTPYIIHAYSGSDFLNGTAVIPWTEDTLTYSNMPSYNTTSMNSVSGNIGSQWYNWNVVDAVKNALASNSKTATIVLFDPSPVSYASTVDFPSKETGSSALFGDYRPALTIHWSSSVPEFPTFLILPSFMTATLIAVIFCRKKAMP